MSEHDTIWPLVLDQHGQPNQTLIDHSRELLNVVIAAAEGNNVGPWAKHLLNEIREKSAPPKSD